MVLPISVGQVQELLPDVVGVGDGAENDVQVLRGGFDADVAIIKERGEKSMNIGRHVLDAKEIKLGDGAGEESELLHVHDAVIGDNPNVQVVINKVHEEKEIDAKVVDARREDGRGKEFVASKQCREARGNNKVDKNWQGEQEQK